MVEVGLAGVLLVVLSLLVFWYADGLSSYSPKALTYQCIGDITMEYSETARFQEKDGRVVVSDDKNSGDIDDVPILIKESTDLILPKNYELMVPVEAIKVRRLNRFTKVSENSGIIIYTSGKKKASSNGGFLFDGGDIYIFLEDTTLYIGSSAIELPAMSYAIAKYNRYVEYHNSETGETVNSALYETDVTARAKSGFELNLTNDVVYANGEEAIIYSAVDDVKLLEME